jgi:hypothetical protein
VSPTANFCHPITLGGKALKLGMKYGVEFAVGAHKKLAGRCTAQVMRMNTHADETLVENAKCYSFPSKSNGRFGLAKKPKPVSRAMHNKVQQIMVVRTGMGKVGCWLKASCKG